MLLSVSDLKGVLHTIFGHSFFWLQGCWHFLWQIAEHKERLTGGDTHQLSRVRPENLKTGGQKIVRALKQ